MSKEQPVYPAVPSAPPQEIPPPYAIQNNISCVSLHESDKLRLMGFTPEEIAFVKQAISTSWSQGIQAESKYAGAYQIKLKGNPWWGQGSEAVPSRLLIAAILRHLLNMGWLLTLSTDISKKQYDKDTLFLRRTHPDPSAFICSISFNRTDRIRLIGAPPHLQSAVHDTIVRCWSKGLQDQKVYEGHPEWKLKGNPWWADSNETVQVRMFLARLIEAVERVGFVVYASVDISQGTGENNGDVDSWFLRQVRAV
ncbi:hypothetical protein HK097_000526 [Rhizophlyctis rosea]|uniref:Uncharacterized protein n=1 Tax=Rhizophlyctis rosea TaxID=64517 RepID=A0AAD5S5F2_9FUNG|nr:hypothetical protein HK097_000526 [Rhizophlyctis rosea]